MLCRICCYFYRKQNVWFVFFIFINTVTTCNEIFFLGGCIKKTLFLVILEACFIYNKINHFINILHWNSFWQILCKIINIHTCTVINCFVQFSNTMLQMLECCSIQAWWLWIVQTYNNGSVFLKHKLLKPIVCRVDVQILLFENEDQNYLISIFFNGFTICWFVVLHKKSKFVPVLLCYYRYFGRNPSH